MWPLPASIDAAQAYAAIPRSMDVDGAHFHGRPDAVAPMIGTHPPVGCQGIVRVLEDHGVSLEGRHVAVIGRSWLVGQPLTQLLSAKGATVTLMHRSSKNLVELCAAADVVISAAGQPGILDVSALKAGVVVVNVGTTFKDDDLVPDILPTGDTHPASLLVHSVGPIWVAMLLRNAAENAAARQAPTAVGASFATASSRTSTSPTAHSSC
mmetsp:Transcript_106176/g.338953  ORF Transcript_106176/g.338953 Transcript_106176/m.338953 type:complete len:210 (-) Transcript_106176:306-935(-)